jgi:hypothetical protein
MKVWNFCLAASLATHLVLFLGYPAFITGKRSDTKAELKNKDKTVTIHPQTIEKLKPRLNPETPSAKAPQPLPYVEKMLGEIRQTSSQRLFNKSAFLDKNANEILVTQEPPEKALLENPAYMDYYRHIREKIRANTYRNYDISKQGEILANFLVMKDGTLQDMELSAKDGQQIGLQEIARKSIEKAAPFPTFPQELQEYSSLRFNVLIYFKNN